MPRPSLLIIEDDRALAEVLTYNLTQAGYQVTVARDGRDGLAQARRKLPHVIVLDLMIPVVDGIEVCKQLRAGPTTRDVPIVMLTAKSEESDQLVGFSVGADDYVVKPFSVKVLLERIKSVTRRRAADAGQSPDVVTQGNITIDRLKHRVWVNGQPKELTPSEFRLLDALIRQPGRAFDRSELIDAALGADTLVLERTIDVHIRALRKKLGMASDAIETVRGVGYRFRDPAVSAAVESV